MTNSAYHIPVLLHESIEGLSIIPGGTYVDLTFGGGGHAAEILKRLGANGKLVAFDKDPGAIRNLADDKRLVWIGEDFRYMKRFLRLQGIRQVDGILADLGVSSYQIDRADRGFSTRYDARLDMRMNPGKRISAFQVVNDYPQEELARLFREYGELKNARRIASEIVEARRNKKIETTAELMRIIEPALVRRREFKTAAQVFQAIRIEVNDEINALKEMLRQVPDVLKPGGRLCVISYHSLEDRLVKRFIRNGMFEGEPQRDVYGNYEVPLRKVGKLIVPEPSEIERNNRARSAKLRIAEKI